MKIALIHEHLVQDGGAEKVLQAFQELYPTAPTYTLIYDRDKANVSFQGNKIFTSYLQKMPFSLRRYQWYLPWMPDAIERFDLSEYDVVLSSCSAFAKGVITLADTLHICYCHSPTRYLWSDTHRYVEDLHFPKIIKNYIRSQLPRIRQWDQLAAQRVDEFIANSTTVQKRIMKYYRRPSSVIYPPVDISRFRISDQIGNYYLTGGRLVAYKRFDVAIQAFNQLGLPLKVYGSGPEEKNLRKMAKGNIQFLGRVSDDERMNLYSQAKAFINPQEEDFGITVIEAMASGRPVIAFAKGGALETVIDGRTGVFFHDQNWAALADTVLRFKIDTIDPRAIRQHAATFNIDRFKEQIHSYIETRHSAMTK
jgi:glycosyltransferase involved in cell wall biosynthesis